MRNLKRFLTLALAVMMVASMFAFGTSAAQFTDVDENDEYLAKAVNLLNYVGVVKGTSETTFGTDELVTREQMAAFIYRLMKKGSSVEGGTNSSRFTDLEDPTYFFMVSWADSQNIIKGINATTFDPKGSITLQDAYTMVVRALGYEKEASLPYPFGYIGVAEDDGVELGEGLSSDITYTDALTRGDVAIILYNAFFAETGVPETKQVQDKIGDDDAATWVLRTETTYPLLCEKVFNVKEIEYQAIATPHYVFNGETETTTDLGYEAILMDKVDDSTDEDIMDAAQQFYADAAELGLEGKADDYIMSHFTVYAVLKDSESEKGKLDIEKILFAEPLLSKKTVNEIKLEAVSDNNKSSYYLNDDSALGAKRLSGKAIVDGSAVYFYNAPYSYAKPNYGTNTKEYSKYNARNAKNVQFMTLEVLGDAEDGEYEIRNHNLFPKYEEVDYDSNHTDYSETLIYALSQVYTDGLYEADFYDVDGDGLYDYINYKPYSFFFVDTDEDADYDFVDDDAFFTEDGKNYVYTKGAKLEGETFKDDDLVLGYFDQAANLIKAAAIVKPVEATVSKINDNDSVTLSSGEKVFVTDAWKLVANYDQSAALEAAGYDLNEVVLDDFYNDTDFDQLLTSAVYDNDKTEYYFYNDVLLYTGDINVNTKFDGNLIIVTTDDEGNAIETGSFNSATGERATYVYAWVDGKTKWVPVDTDAEIYPLIDKNINTYVNKLATYSVDSDGLYTIQLLGNAYDDKAMTDDDYIGMEIDPAEVDFESEKESGKQLLVDLDTVEDYLVKKVGKRFTLDNTAMDYDLLLNKDTIVLINSHYKEDAEDDELGFTLYTVDELTESLESKLYNIQYVVANNTNYTNREDLVLFFAETDDDLTLAGKTSSKSERIVRNVEAVAGEDGKYYAAYTLLNPYTGETVTLNGNKSYSKATQATSNAFSRNDIIKVSGSIVEYKTSNKVGTFIGGNTAANLYWILDYDAESDMIEVVPAGEEDAASIRLSTENVVVTQFGSQSTGFEANGGNEMYRWAFNFSKLAVSDLGSDSKSLKTIKTDYVKDPTDPDETFKTVYGKYIKAYINIEWEEDADHTATNEDTNCNGEAKFVTVIVHKGENVDLCKTTTK